MRNICRSTGNTSEPIRYQLKQSLRPRPLEALIYSHKRQLAQHPHNDQVSVIPDENSQKDRKRRPDERQRAEKIDDCHTRAHIAEDLSHDLRQLRRHDREVQGIDDRRQQPAKKLLDQIKHATPPSDQNHAATHPGCGQGSQSAPRRQPRQGQSAQQ